MVNATRQKWLFSNEELLMVHRASLHFAKGMAQPKRPTRAQLEQEEVQNMMRRNAALYHAMEDRLAKFSKAALLTPSRQFAQRAGIRGPGRLCQRSKQAMICWFCKHVPNFPEGFPPMDAVTRTRGQTRPRLSEMTQPGSTIGDFLKSKTMISSTR
jgi:hypothetical protein